MSKLSNNKIDALGIITGVSNISLGCEFGEEIGEILSIIEPAERYIRGRTCVRKDMVSFIESIFSSNEIEFRKKYQRATTPSERRDLWVEVAQKYDVPIQIRNYSYGSKVP